MDFNHSTIASSLAWALKLLHFSSWLRQSAVKTSVRWVIDVVTATNLFHNCIFEGLYSLRGRNRCCSPGRERLRKPWRQQSAQWHHWFIAWFSVSFLSISFGLFSLRSLRTGSLLRGLITAVFTACFPPVCSQCRLCLELRQETPVFPDYSQIYTLLIFAYLFRLRG